MKPITLLASILMLWTSVHATPPQPAQPKSSLPPTLSAANEKAKSLGEPYPGFYQDVETVRRHLGNGKRQLAEFTSKRILRQIKNRQAGVPEDLQVLVQEINSEPTRYPGIEPDLKRLSTALDKGQHKKARALAQRIIRQKRNLGQPIPADLKSSVQKIETEAADYPGRESDLRRITEFIASGQYTAARRRSRRVLKRQENVRKPPPDALLELVAAVEEERVDYPGRSKDTARFMRTIEEHNYERAMSRGQSIRQQQANLRQGIPEDLSNLLSTMEEERVEYGSREQEMLRVKRALEQGKFKLARAQALQIIEQQRHLRD